MADHLIDEDKWVVGTCTAMNLLDARNRQNNANLFGHELFEVRPRLRLSDIDNYNLRCTWDSARWSLTTKQNLHVPLRTVREISITFLVNNPPLGAAAVRARLFWQDIPLAATTTDVFDFHHSTTTTSIVEFKKLLPQWLSTPPMPLKVPYTSEDEASAHGAFDFQAVEGTTAAAKVLRFNLEAILRLVGLFIFWLVGWLWLTERK
jgi:hypothetical protein